MNKVLITGATGFIGRNLIDYCLNENIKVIAVVQEDDVNAGLIEFSHVKIIRCDGKNFDKLSKLITDKDIDACIHLAWGGSSGNLRADFGLQLNNVENSLKLISALNSLKIKRFIGAGTLAEIDVLNYHGKDGSVPNTVSHYGVAKIATHYMTKSECSQFKIEHIWCYLGNTYGVGNTTQNFINFASDLLMSNKKAEFTSGEQWYDFIYVTDTVKAIMSLLKFGKSNHSYYIGSSRPKKLKEYIIIMRNIINKNKELYLGAIPYKGESNELSVYDTNKLFDDTGFVPEIEFENGFIRTINWKKGINDK